MSDFRTTFTIPPHPTSFSHKEGILLIGSCFSESIGSLLQHHKIPTLINPVGTLFNPISIFKAIEFSLGITTPTTTFNTLQQGTWYHYQTHSIIKGKTENELNNNLIKALKNTQEFNKSAKTLIITFGTSFVYEHITSGEIVANCHKTPQKNFKKRLLTHEEITTAFEQLYPHLTSFENIIFTLSPVRHTKDTIPLNSVSKSILRVVCHELQEKYTNVTYFPSYELLMDDLRDYRFYKDDFIHPTDFAVNYVWEKFQQTYFTEHTQSLLKEINNIQQSLAHRPFNIETEAFLKFQNQLLEKMQKLNDDVDFNSEIEEIKKLFLV